MTPSDGLPPSDRLLRVVIMPGPRVPFIDRELAERGIGLVYGGSARGLMVFDPSPAALLDRL